MIGQVSFLKSLKVLLVTHKVRISALHLLFSYYRLFWKFTSSVSIIAHTDFRQPPLSHHRESEISLTYGTLRKQSMIFSDHVLCGV